MNPIVFALAALWASEMWHATWVEYRRSPNPDLRRFALYARTRCVVAHDRALVMMADREQNRI